MNRLVASLHTCPLLSSCWYRSAINAESEGTKRKIYRSTSRSSSPSPPSTGSGGAAIAGWAVRMCSPCPSSISSCRRGAVRKSERFIVFLPMIEPQRLYCFLRLRADVLSMIEQQQQQQHLCSFFQTARVDTDAFVDGDGRQEYVPELRG